MVYERSEGTLIASRLEWDAILETIYIAGEKSMMGGLHESAEDIKVGKVSHYTSMSDLRTEILADATGPLAE